MKPLVELLHISLGAKEMVVVSRSGTEYHRAVPLDDWESLKWRELEWRCLPEATRKGIIPYLTVRETGRLDCAMTNREARRHLVKSYKGMQSPAFNGYVYEYWGKEKYTELKWARDRGVDLRGFTLKYRLYDKSGYVLVRLLGGWSKEDLNLNIATYFATRGKLTHLDDTQSGHTALTKACNMGCTGVVMGLLTAGASRDTADNDGDTPLIHAVKKAHLDIVLMLVAAGADIEKADEDGNTPCMWAANSGNLEIANLLLAAGATMDKANSGDSADSSTKAQPKSFSRSFQYSWMVLSLLAVAAAMLWWPTGFSWLHSS